MHHFPSHRQTCSILDELSCTLFMAPHNSDFSDCSVLTFLLQALLSVSHAWSIHLFPVWAASSSHTFVTGLSDSFHIVISLVRIIWNFCEGVEITSLPTSGYFPYYHNVLSWLYRCAKLLISSCILVTCCLRNWSPRLSSSSVNIVMSPQFDKTCPLLWSPAQEPKTSAIPLVSPTMYPLSVGPGNRQMKGWVRHSSCRSKVRSIQPH